MKTLINTLALLALATGAAHAQGVKKADGILVTDAGLTVYTFDKDTAGKSNCAGQCLQNWPAVAPVGNVAAPYSVITRDDGSKQLAYKDKPLYLFVKDTKPGDRNGDNFRDVWRLVKD